MNKRFSELTVSATDFANDDVIALDGETNGTRKMSGSALKSAMKTNTLATADSNAYIVSDGDVVRIKDLETSITAFRTGDLIPVDGPSGTAKMSKEDLLRETAENALGSIHSLSYTATEADLVVGNHLVVDTTKGAKRLPAYKIATRKNTDFINFERITNGKFNILGDGYGVTRVEQKNTDGSFILRRASAGSTWSYFPAPFQLKPRKLLISFDAQVTENNTDPNAVTFVYVSNGSGTFATGQQIQITPNMPLPYSAEISFDPSTQPDWSNFNVWVCVGGHDGVVAEIKVSNLLVYQLEEQEKDYKHFSGSNLDKILDSIDSNIVDGDIMGADKTNGNLITYKSGNQDLNGAYKKNTDGSFILRRASAGNNWTSYANPIIPNFSHLVYIEFNVDTTENNTNPITRGQVIVSNGGSTTASSIYKSIVNYNPSESNKVSVTFDPSYYQIYVDPSFTKFNIWISITGKDGYVTEYKITNLKIYQQVGEVLFENFGGKTSKELFEGIDRAFNEVTKKGETLIVSPSGNQYLLSVQDNGTIKTIPFIPSKAAFFGNSLLSGSGTFGMAASDAEHDYFNLIQSYIITNLNSSYTATRIGGVALENLVNTANISSTIDSLVSSLDGDENLVVVQLGDNVNTTEKVDVFATSAQMFLTAIRSKCQNARVVWLGMWYGSDVKYSIIKEACEKTGCEFVSIASLVNDESRSHIGALQNKGVNNYTLTDVFNVVENSTGNITISFAVSGTNYTTTMDVNSWELRGTTLNYNGTYYVITSAGVASHPGDVGMAAIADKFLTDMGYKI